MRKNISSGAPWEEHIGYSRAVRIGNEIEVSGTVSVLKGKLVGKNDPYIQTKNILTIIRSALEEAGGSMNDVIRTRIYVTDISNWEDIGRAHGEVFRDIRPATSMVEVGRLIDENYLVEIEASAIIAT